MVPQALACALAAALVLVSHTAHGFSPAGRVGRRMQLVSRLPAVIPVDVVIPAGPSVPCAAADVQIVHTGGDVSGTCDFWMRTTVPGAVTQKTMSKLMGEAKKNANFPGFRKGQIPPYAMPKMVGFCLEEAVNSGMLDAVNAAGLRPLAGKDAKAEVLEDTKKLAKTFKAGTPFTFTATFKGTFLESASGAGPVAAPNVDAASLEPVAQDAEVVEPAATVAPDAEVVSAEVAS